MIQKRSIKRENSFGEIVISKGKRKIPIVVRRCNSLEKFIGLMFSHKNKENLLFDFKKNTNISIHSFFVFYDFLAVWLDDKNEIIEFKIIKPFSTINAKPSVKYRRLVEIPINSNNELIVNSLVGK